MNTPRVDCIRCLQVIEIIFELMQRLKAVENIPDSNNLKARATIQAMHKICCAITQLRISPQEE
jgi:hypothetical protein